jgi:starvation-inducible outer membrane lipoprotein
VAEVEDEIEMESVPAAVKAAVKKAARGGGKITVVTNGKKKSLELNPDGVLLK